MQQEEIIRDIRQRCRKAMNGIASTSMRQRGISYKVNFGLNIQQIKEFGQIRCYYIGHGYQSPHLLYNSDIKARL